MTIWLQKRLAIWTGAALLSGALVWNAGASRAQSRSVETPRKKLTRDEAAKNFSTTMTYFTRRDERSIRNVTGMIIPISRKSKTQLGNRVSDLLEEMALQWQLPNHTRALILIEEKSGWGVDLIETYAKWNNLQGVATTTAILKITSIAVEGLPRDERFNRHACQSNMKYIALGMMQYVQDHDEKYPPAKSWLNELQQLRPFLKSEELFTCPALPKGQKYGYAYNSKFSTKSEASLYDLEKSVSVYETSILKRNAYGSGENLAFRHGNGANYAFADGHIKWFAKTTIPSFKLKP